MADDPATTFSPFYSCYLLRSLNPRTRGRTYIGFTVDPKRRLQQHNGCGVNGASKTRRFRPWEMVLVVHGFSTQVEALQFEWAWQHPFRSLTIKDRVSNTKPMHGLNSKASILRLLLTSQKWNHLPLHIQFLSTAHTSLLKFIEPFPPQMTVNTEPIDFLPCYRSQCDQTQMRFDKYFRKNDADEVIIHEHTGARNLTPRNSCGANLIEENCDIQVTRGINIPEMNPKKRKNKVHYENTNTNRKDQQMHTKTALLRNTIPSMTKTRDGERQRIREREMYASNGFECGLHECFEDSVVGEALKSCPSEIHSNLLENCHILDDRVFIDSTFFELDNESTSDRVVSCEEEELICLDDDDESDKKVLIDCDYYVNNFRYDSMNDLQREKDIHLIYLSCDDDGDGYSSNDAGSVNLINHNKVDAMFDFKNNGCNHGRQDHDLNLFDEHEENLVIEFLHDNTTRVDESKFIDLTLDTHGSD